MPPDAPERIRRAAVELFGERGYAGTTVRAIAERADVSPGLVIHHFGGKERLRAACDELVAEAIRAKAPILEGVDLPDPAALRDLQAEAEPLRAYLVRMIGEGGAGADALFARMVELTEGMLAAGERAGTVRPSDDSRARTAMLVAYSLAAPLLGGQLASYLGYRDPRDAALQHRLGRASVEVLVRGMFTDERLLALITAMGDNPEPGIGRKTDADSDPEQPDSNPADRR
ncbi:TetR family transcriptional regulator [Naumannella cuiyingiana]|uniref:AcrR family transcriptional regulator n=1 Tax=Naumannella cuiyingiana TaxID=1347891 RepID=A0A7Z0DA79_9ACTN|nr:TetR family transcriptional regulator [Naumannella cuiyingiana]NYI71822.1 AcrR family transcriptional regulator [Naumannella cuiyingiana]